MGQLADWNLRFSAQGPHKHKCRHGSNKTFRVSVKQITQVLSLVLFNSKSIFDETFFDLRFSFETLISFLLKI